jgi:hypothetical protein
MYTHAHSLPATNNRREDARECFVDERHHHESGAIVALAQNFIAIDASAKVCSHHLYTKHNSLGQQIIAIV